MLKLNEEEAGVDERSVNGEVTSHISDTREVLAAGNPSLDTEKSAGNYNVTVSFQNSASPEGDSGERDGVRIGSGYTNSTGPGVGPRILSEICGLREKEVGLSSTAEGTIGEGPSCKSGPIEGVMNGLEEVREANRVGFLGLGNTGEVSVQRETEGEEGGEGRDESEGVTARRGCERSADYSPSDNNLGRAEKSERNQYDRQQWDTFINSMASPSELELGKKKKRKGKKGKRVDKDAFLEKS